MAIRENVSVRLQDTARRNICVPTIKVFQSDFGDLKIKAKCKFLNFLKQNPDVSYSKVEIRYKSADGGCELSDWFPVKIIGQNKVTGEKLHLYVAEMNVPIKEETADEVEILIAIGFTDASEEEILRAKQMSADKGVKITYKK